MPPPVHIKDHWWFRSDATQNCALPLNGTLPNSSTIKAGRNMSQKRSLFRVYLPFPRVWLLVLKDFVEVHLGLYSASWSWSRAWLQGERQESTKTTSHLVREFNVARRQNARTLSSAKFSDANSGWKMKVCSPPSSCTCSLLSTSSMSGEASQIWTTANCVIELKYTALSESVFHYDLNTLKVLLAHATSRKRLVWRHRRGKMHSLSERARCCRRPLGLRSWVIPLLPSHHARNLLLF